MLTEVIINKIDSWNSVIAFVICSEVCGDLREIKLALLSISGIAMFDDNNATIDQSKEFQKAAWYHIYIYIYI